MAQRRTGRGIWYASVRVWLWSDERHQESREIATVEERCAGRDAAVVAARRLLAEQAHRFGALTSVEAEVFTELEWAPMTRERQEE